MALKYAPQNALNGKFWHLDSPVISGVLAGSDFSRVMFGGESFQIRPRPCDPLPLKKMGVSISAN